MLRQISLKVFWSSATAGICYICLWLIGSVSLHAVLLDLTVLGRFPFLLDCVMELHDIKAVLTLLLGCRQLPCLFSVWLQVYSLMI